MYGYCSVNSVTYMYLYMYTYMLYMYMLMYMYMRYMNVYKVLLNLREFPLMF